MLLYDMLQKWFYDIGVSSNVKKSLKVFIYLFPSSPAGSTQEGKNGRIQNYVVFSSQWCGYFSSTFQFL